MLTLLVDVTAKLKSECLLKILFPSTFFFLSFQELFNMWIVLYSFIELFHTCYMIIPIWRNCFKNREFKLWWYWFRVSHYFQAEVNWFDLNKNPTTLILSQVFVNLQFSLTNIQCFPISLLLSQLVSNGPCSELVRWFTLVGKGTCFQIWCLTLISGTYIIEGQNWLI